MKILRLEEAKDWAGLGELTPEQLKEAYALARASLTADDIRRFTEVDENPITMEAFLADLENVQQEHDRKPTQ
jgi:hypothetical protein